MAKALLFSFINRFSTCDTKSIALAMLVVFGLSAYPNNSSSENIELPTIGDAGLGVMSRSEEEVLGQAWLKAFRGGVRLYEDPIVHEYIENLLYKLASHSETGDKSLDVIVVDNNTINAFAVPGGVVGVHTGLISSAENEAQLASVLAHELAHLYQRHFARGIDASRGSNWVTLLGTLTGIAIAVSGGSSDAALAAIVSGQAAAIDNQLSYSRLHEREADRLGMQTLVQAGYSAQGAAQMFQVMQARSRSFGREIPEFLLTHPVTQSRISDARLRERQIAREHEKENRILPKQMDSIDFQLVKARISVKNSETAKDAINQFAYQLKKAGKSKDSINIPSTEVIRYGLALSYMHDNQYKAAREQLAPLLNQVPGRILYSLLDIEIDITAGKTEQAERRLRDLYALNPSNYSIGMRLADLLMERNKATDAAIVLANLSRRWPKQSSIWYHLAEAQGKANDIFNLHRARAEFFYLNGRYRESLQQLQQASRYAKNDVKATASLRQRVKEINSVRKKEQELGITLN